MKLTGYSLTNFCCIRHAEVNLLDRGLVFVSGENRDTESANSNGSGKSTLFKGLTWILYEKTIDGDKGNEVILQGEKSAIGVAFLEDEDSRIWTVKRTRKKNKPLLEILDPESKPLDLPKNELQEKIEEWVGHDFDSFRNTILYGQNDSNRFADPRTKDSERKGMLHRLLRTGIFSQCHERVLERRRDLNKRQTKSEGEIGKTKAKIEEYDLDGLRKSQADFEEGRTNRLGQKKDQVVETVDKIKKKKSSSEEWEAAVRRVTRLEKAISGMGEAMQVNFEDRSKAKAAKEKAQKELFELDDKLHENERERKSLDEQLKLLKDDKCPTCSSSLKSGEGKLFVEGLVVRRNLVVSGREPLLLGHEEVTGRFHDFETEVEIVDAKLERQQKELNKLHEELSDAKTRVVELGKDAERVDEWKKDAKRLMDEMEEILEELNPWDEKIQESTEKWKTLQDKLAQQESDLEELTTDLAHVEFWVRGFGDQGLPSFVLDSVMGYLTERTNEYLRVLSDGDITMTFSTQRELKSKKGEVRDEIEIAWTIEGNEGVTPSGGQRKKMEIATDLALMDLASTREAGHLNLLLLDEVLDGLDQQGRTRVLALLERLREDRNSVFVISHEAELSESFERVLHVIKEEGESRVEVFE